MRQPSTGWDGLIPRRLSDEWLSADKFSIRDFFVFLQANSSSSIFAKEFGKCNIPETQ